MSSRERQISSALVVSHNKFQVHFNSLVSTLKPQRITITQQIQWLVHWPLMGGLSHLVQWGGDWAGCTPTRSLPCCAKCNSPPINGQCTVYQHHSIRCGAIITFALYGVNIEHSHWCICMCLLTRFVILVHHGCWRARQKCLSLELFLGWLRRSVYCVIFLYWYYIYNSCFFCT